MIFLFYTIPAIILFLMCVNVPNDEWHKVIQKSELSKEYNENSLKTLCIIIISFIPIMNVLFLIYVIIEAIKVNIKL